MASEMLKELRSLRVIYLQVNEILARSSVWSAFKDQKHDLFISESQTAGYLTGEVFERYHLALTFFYQAKLLSFFSIVLNR